MYSYYFI